MNKYKTLLSNTVIFAIGTFSSKVLVFLMLPFYTNILTTEEYGTVDLLVQSSNVLLPLVSVGIINGVVRFGLDKHYRKRDVFTTGLLSILGGFLLLLALSPVIRMFSFFQGHMVLLYSFILMSSLRSLCSQFVRARGLVRLYAFDGILATATTIFFNILYLAVLRLGITGYMLAMFSSDLLSVIFLTFSARLWKYLHLKGLNRGTSRDMLRYSVPLIPNTMMWWITNVSDRYIVTWALGLAINGLYGIAYKVPSIITLVSGLFMDAWQMSAVIENDQDRERFFSKVFSYYQALIFTGASGLILCCKLMTLILNPSYYDAWRYMPFLLMATVFNCMVSFLGTVYMVEKKSMMNMATTVVGAVLNIVLSWLLVQVPVFEANGATFATFASYFVVFLLRAANTRRFIRIRMHAGKMAFNTIILLIQTLVMLTEPALWLPVELVLTAVMVLTNMGELWATVRRVLVRVLRNRAAKSTH